MTEEQWMAYVENITAKFVTMVDWHTDLVRQNNELIAENKKLRAEVSSARTQLDAQEPWANALLDGLPVPIKSTRTGKLKPCEYCRTISNVFPRTCCNQGQFDDTSLASLTQEKGDE